MTLIRVTGCVFTLRARALNRGRLMSKSVSSTPLSLSLILQKDLKLERPGAGARTTRAWDHWEGGENSVK